MDVWRLVIDDKHDRAVESMTGEMKGRTGMTTPMTPFPRRERRVTKHSQAAPCNAVASRAASHCTTEAAGLRQRWGGPQKCNCVRVRIARGSAAVARLWLKS